MNVDILGWLSRGWKVRRCTTAELKLAESSGVDVLASNKHVTLSSSVAYITAQAFSRALSHSRSSHNSHPLTCAYLSRWRDYSMVSLEALSHLLLQFLLAILVRCRAQHPKSQLTTTLADFADFAEAPDPSPASFSAIPSAPSFTGAGAVPTGASAVPYTKWYNIHERHSLSDFKQEGVILGLILIIVMIHLYGTSTNRKKAKAWISAHAPILRNEFALVGFGGRRAPSVEEVESEGLLKSMASDSLDLPEELLKEKSPQEFATYATGRLNIAFVDITLTLLKRYSPLSMIAEYGMSLFFDSMPAPVERMEAISYPFDGREALTVPGQAPGAHELRKDPKSSYDGFVWAIVNKDTMKQLRDDRYDVSITTTKDHSKLPTWSTVMSESAEVTEQLLTKDLVEAVEKAGDLLDHLIITDQPTDQPLK